MPAISNFIFEVISFALLFPKVVVSNACNKTDAEMLYPCGNATYFALRFGTGLPEYYLLDDPAKNIRFCYSKPSDFSNIANRVNCKPHVGPNGRLAEFPTAVLFYKYVAILAKLTYYEDILWVGGRRRGEHWFWNNGTEKINLDGSVWLGAEDEDEDEDEDEHENGENCMYYQSGVLQPGKCNMHERFICQKDPEEEYYGYLDVRVFPKKKIFSVSDAATVSCMARSWVGLNMTINTNQGYPYIVNTMRGSSDLSPLEGSFTFAKEYVIHGNICVLRISLNVTFNMTRKMDSSNITCCHKEQRNVRKFQPCQSISVKVDYGPERPEVRIEFSEGKTKQTVSFPTRYSCIAKLGQGQAMTFVIDNSDKQWRRRFRISGGEDEEDIVGDTQPWMDEIQFSKEAGKDDFLSGNYIKLWVVYTPSYLMDLKFGCYSRDVLNNLANLTVSDYLSHWYDFGKAELVRRVKLSFLKIADKIEDGIVPVYGCEVFEMSCTGHGATREMMKIVITDDSGKHEWNEASQNSLQSWASVKKVKDIEDPMFGQSAVVNLTIKVTEAIEKTKIACSVKTDSKETTDQPDVVFRLLKGASPPDLKVIRSKKDDPDTYLSLTCEVSTGEDPTMTWKILTASGDSNIVYVDANGTVSGLTFSWLQISEDYESWDEVCGLKLTSILRMLKTIDEIGVTFTCYSYDLRHPDLVQSRYTIEELGHDYSVFGGGQEKQDDDDDDNEGTTNKILFYVVFVGSIFSMFLCCLYAISQRKHLPQDATTFDLDGNTKTAEAIETASESVGKGPGSVATGTLRGSVAKESSRRSESVAPSNVGSDKI